MNERIETQALSSSPIIATLIGAEFTPLSIMSFAPDHGVQAPSVLIMAPCRRATKTGGATQPVFGTPCHFAEITATFALILRILEQY
jgi:hypothetical protein